MACVTLGARMFHLIATHAVNLLWVDEWELYGAFWKNASWSQLFFWQSGPQRQGISFILLKYLAEATDWDSKTTAFAVGALVALSCAAALSLKRRIAGEFELSDLIIPLIFFTPQQYEIFLGPAIPAYSSFPQLLVLFFCLARTLASIWLRYGLAVVIDFLAIYSGYGFFLGLVAPLLFLLDALRARKGRRPLETKVAWCALLASLASLLSFFWGYRFNPAAACFRFPLTPVWNYPRFMALMFANPLRLKGHGPLTTLAGFLLLGLALYLLRRCLQQGWKERSPSAALDRASAALLGFVLFYSSAAAAGRLCFGLDAAQESRYVVFMNLALLAFYLQSLTWPRGVTRSRAMAAFAVILAAGQIFLSHRDRVQMEYFRQVKTAWKQCYLQQEDIPRCDAAAGAAAFPLPAATQMQEKLQYMKERKLNLYNGR